MSQRGVTLNGERHVLDVVGPTTQPVRTPWGMLTAKPGDVLIPWGVGVVPVPGALLDALTQSDTLPPDRSKDWIQQVEDQLSGLQTRGERVDLDGLKRHELVKLGAKQFPRAKPWFKMSREALLTELRERGL